MRAKRFMKYTTHPEADKRAAQMVWRGRGRTGVDVVRREPPPEAPAANPLPRVERAPKAQPEPVKRDE